MSKQEWERNIPRAFRINRSLNGICSILVGRYGVDIHLDVPQTIAGTLVRTKDIRSSEKYALIFYERFFLVRSCKRCYVVSEDKECC